MPSLEELTLYFFIACGVGTGAFCMLFVLVTILFFKLRQMKVDGSNQLNRQTNMMADFCYTNPTIVPGEELSRRGFSMYSGSGHISSVDFGNKTKDYNTHHEARSKF